MLISDPSGATNHILFTLIRTIHSLNGKIGMFSLTLPPRQSGNGFLTDFVTVFLTTLPVVITTSSESFFVSPQHPAEAVKDWIPQDSSG